MSSGDEPVGNPRTKKGRSGVGVNELRREMIRSATRRDASSGFGRTMRRLKRDHQSKGRDGEEAEEGKERERDI